MRLVIFDFCETLIPYQTADKFVDFVHERTKFENRLWINVSGFLSFKPLVMLSNKFLPKFNYEKRIHLMSLRGIDKERLETLSSEYAKSISKDTIDLLKGHLEHHRRQGDRIVIISGGYELYLKHFKEIYKLKDCFGTKIGFKNGKCTGLFEGKDCMFETKVEVLDEILKNMTSKVAETVCYTDSISDLPILEHVDDPVVVSCCKQQEWAKSNNFREIIWQSSADNIKQ